MMPMEALSGGLKTLALCLGQCHNFAAFCLGRSQALLINFGHFQFGILDKFSRIDPCFMLRLFRFLLSITNVFYHFYQQLSHLP
jgi:hypothetical protein